MRLLLDSHAALWAITADPQLGDRTRQAVLDADEVVVSVVTPWELGIKRALGKIHYPDGLVDAFRSSGFEMLPITSVHATLAPQLPPHHRDPFDRMLIAQAQFDDYTIVTADAVFEGYNVGLWNCRT